ncbi:MAG: hypothetical protein ACO23H_20835 [Alphaproteobacteria bacterium]
MASVAEIDGLTVPLPGINPYAPSSGFLFTYSGAAAAYSVRQLNNNAPYVLRVRRVTGVGNTGNDDEADVKFDTTLTNPTISLDSPVDNFSAGGSNATTLGEFLNVGTVGGTTYSDADSLFPNTAEAYVDTWYDLTGNQKHAEQTTPSLQPQIHSGTAGTDLITENGKPILNLGWDMQTSLLGNSTAYIFAVFKAEANKIMMSDIGQGSDYLLLAQSGSSGSATGGFSVNNYYLNGTLTSISTRNDAYLALNLNNQQQAVFDLDSSNVTIGYEMGYSQTGTYKMYDMQELIIYHIDQSLNRSGIETNQNTYFSIY